MRAVLVAAAIAVGAMPVSAQQRPRSDSLPRELVTALLGGSMGAPAIDIVAGFADTLLPRPVPTRSSATAICVAR
jgi:hypothetical protein